MVNYNFYTYLRQAYLRIEDTKTNEFYHYNVSEWTPFDVEEVMVNHGIKMTQHIWEHIQDVLSKI